jgi:hypothetical protein
VQAAAITIRRNGCTEARITCPRRVWHDVLAEGLDYGLHHIELLMRQQGLRARPRRRGLPKDAGQSHVASPNILDRAFEHRRQHPHRPSRQLPDYSWQGGIDFLATFSPGVLDGYPSTLLGAVTAVHGQEDALGRQLAAALPDARFIAIGETLEKTTSALGQLSLAASIVGGLAVGNGLLVLLGSLATGRRQRQADAVISKVLGATRAEVLSVSVVHFVLLATFAALLATLIGIALARLLTMLLLDVDCRVDTITVIAVDLGVIVITGLLGATTIIRPLSSHSARFLRELGAE